MVSNSKLVRFFTLNVHVFTVLYVLAGSFYCLMVAMRECVVPHMETGYSLRSKHINYADIADIVCRLLLLFTICLWSPCGSAREVQVSGIKFTTYNLDFLVLIQQECLLQDKLHPEVVQYQDDQDQALLLIGCGARCG